MKRLQLFRFQSKTILILIIVALELYALQLQKKLTEFTQTKMSFEQKVCKKKLKQKPTIVWWQPFFNDSKVYTSDICS